MVISLPSKQSGQHGCSKPTCAIRQGLHVDIAVRPAWIPGPGGEGGSLEAKEDKLWCAEEAEEERQRKKMSHGLKIHK